jgi:hypothetical protein
MIWLFPYHIPYSSHVILNIQIYYLNFIIMRVLVRNNHYFTNVYRGGSRIYTQTEYKQYWRNFTMDSVCPTYCYIYQDNRCLWCLTTLSTILQLYCGVGNRSATRKPPICRKSLTNIITLCCIEYWHTIAFNDIITITNAIHKNLPSSGTKMASNYDVHSPPWICYS